jgi:predicted permease
VNPQPSLIVLAFAISIVAAAVFGLMPVRRIFRTDPNDAIKSGAQTSGARVWALRDVLLAAQIALCCVTVTAGFVSLRGMSKALTTDIGIQPRNATLTKFDLAQAAYTEESAAQVQKRLQEKLAHLPNVEFAAYSSGTPLSETDTTVIYKKEATEFRPSSQAFEAFHYNISPGYLAAAGTPLLAGRDFQATDTAKTPLVAIVNRQFARTLFQTDDAVGRYFKNRDGSLIQIVGMVADGKYFLLSEDSQEAVYFPIMQQPSFVTSVIVRTHPGASTADMAATVRKIVHDQDPAIAIRSSMPWTNQLAFSFFPAQIATVSLGLFGAFGLLLSITGTFGLASYTVSKRMRELSIRVALGAQAKEILTAALGRLLTLIGTGSVIGISLGLATGHLLSHVVFQASAQDPRVLAAVVFTLLFTGLFSVAGPVRRALHADPATLLREQ